MASMSRSVAFGDNVAPYPETVAQHQKVPKRYMEQPGSVHKTSVVGYFRESFGDTWYLGIIGLPEIGQACGSTSICRVSGIALKL